MRICKEKMLSDICMKHFKENTLANILCKNDEKISLVKQNIFLGIPLKMFF